MMKSFAFIFVICASMSNPEKEFDLTQDPDTKSAAAIVLNAIKNLSTEIPTLGKTISTHFANLHWFKSCQPLKVVDDHDFTTSAKLNIAQGAVQDVQRNSVIWGELENKNKSDLVKARLIGHEVLLNTFGKYVPRDYLARASQKFMSYATQPSSDPWPTYQVSMSGVGYKKKSGLDAFTGYFGPYAIGVCTFVTGSYNSQNCRVAITFTYQDIHWIKDLTFRAWGSFYGSVEFYVNGRLVASESVPHPTPPPFRFRVRNLSLQRSHFGNRVSVAVGN